MTHKLTGGRRAARMGRKCVFMLSGVMEEDAVGKEEEVERNGGKEGFFDGK